VARVLIIGATSAIAGEVAKLYAARGDQLFLIGRSQAKIDALIADLGSAVTGYATVDLVDYQAHPALITQATVALQGLDIALICHGVLGDQLQTEASFGDARPVLEVNFMSVVSLLIPIANALESRGSGHIAVITSVAADRGRPKNFTYGAAKAGVNTYLEGLRSRLYRSGVHVHILRAGPVDTPMTANHEKTKLFSTAPVVAAGIVRAIDAGQFSTYLPWFWWFIMTIVVALPEPIFQRLKGLSGR
jgi:short-subunit dehydrogenase